MKKFLIVIVLYCAPAYSEEPYGFFGLNLYSDAKNFLTTSFIEQNKINKPKSLEPFYSLIIGTKIPKKSDYFEFYSIFIDDQDLIHGIKGTTFLNDYTKCKKMLPDLVEGVSSKYKIKFIENEQNNLNYKYHTYNYNSDFAHLVIYCQYGKDSGLIALNLLYESRKMSTDQLKYKDEQY